MPKFISQKITNSDTMTVKFQAEEGEELTTDEALAFAMLEIRSNIEALNNSIHDLSQNVYGLKDYQDDG